MPSSYRRWFFLIVCVLLMCVDPCSYVSATTKQAPAEPEAIIEEVNAKQLEKLLEGKDYVAVFWCKC